MEGNCRCCGKHKHGKMIQVCIHTTLSHTPIISKSVLHPHPGFSPDEFVGAAAGFYVAASVRYNATMIGQEGQVSGHL